MRQTAAKISLFTILLSGIFALSGFIFPGEKEPVTTLAQSTVVSDEWKLNSFEILQAKCNVCHVRQNPWKVFTLENMNKFAPKIYKQVFVKKRMPRGNKIKLTELEYATLEKWLLTQTSIN